MPLSSKKIKTKYNKAKTQRTMKSIHAENARLLIVISSCSPVYES